MNSLDIRISSFRAATMQLLYALPLLVGCKDNVLLGLGTMQDVRCGPTMRDIEAAALQHDIATQVDPSAEPARSDATVICSWNISSEWTRRWRHHGASMGHC
jgi:hypothetical protein